jgi:RNA polymerase primary sigma factor
MAETMSRLPVKSSEDSLGMYLREIRPFPLLTPAQEAALARRARKGDQAALTKLVRHNLRFVIFVAKQYANCGVPLEDLVSEGNLGLIRGAERFDVDRGVRFISYAGWWIRQAILRYLGERSRTVRLPGNRVTALKRITKESRRMTQELGREPTHEELAKRLRLKPEDVESTLGLPTNQLSLDDPVEGRGNGFQLETLSDDVSVPPDVGVMEAMRSEDIKSALAALTPRSEDILKRFYGLDGREPQTLKQIGKAHGVSRERVRQIRNRAMEQLRNSPGASLLSEHYRDLNGGTRQCSSREEVDRTRLGACNTRGARPQETRGLELR